MTPVIETLAIALASGDAQAALPLLAEDAEWEMVGREVLTGREAIAQRLTPGTAATQVTIHRVFAVGRMGAVEGSIALSPTHRRRFCDLYELDGAAGTTVRRITSYDIRA